MNIQPYKGRKDAWRLFWELGMGADGKRKQDSAVFHGTHKAAKEEWIKRAAALGVQAPVVPDRITVGEYLLRWLDESVALRLRGTTLDDYSWAVHSHLIPALGAIRLQKLTTADVQAFVSAKSRDGARLDGRDGKLSVRSVRAILDVLQIALTKAVKWRIVAENVALMVDKPREVKREMQFWSEEEIARFLATAQGHRLFAAFVLALVTGMRAGELLGLHWKDVDFDVGAVRVRETLVRVEGAYMLGGEPKSAKSRRIIDIDATTVAILREHRRAQALERLAIGSAWHDHGLVVASEVGTLINRENFRRSFRAICKRAGVPPIRPHDMRHTNATVLLSRGEDLAVVSERLGHHALTMTLKYTHVVATGKRKAAQTADDAMLRGVRRR